MTITLPSPVTISQYNKEKRSFTPSCNPCGSWPMQPEVSGAQEAGMDAEENIPEVYDKHFQRLRHPQKDDII